MSASIRSFLLRVVIVISCVFSPYTFAATDQNLGPILVLQAKWGGNESFNVPLGLRLNQGWYEGFEYIAVRGKQIFIADSVFERIALFEDNKLIRSYRNPAKWEYGLAIQRDDLFILDKSGYLHRMNLNTEKSISSDTPVITEETGVLTDGRYFLYSLRDHLVINSGGEGEDICVGSQSLKIIPCIGMPKDYLKVDSRAVVLDGEQYITVVKNFALLRDKFGDVIARAYWPNSKSLYADPAWSFTKDGIYFTKHFKKVVEIYFQPWNK